MKKLLVCFLFCVSSAAVAVNWIPSKYPDIYIGKVTNQGIWVKYIYPKPTFVQGGVGKASFVVAKVKADCKNELLNIVKSTYYQEDGSVVGSIGYPTGFFEQTPDSIGEAIMKAVCSYKK